MKRPSNPPSRDASAEAEAVLPPFELLRDLPGIVCGVSTRRRGVSGPPFESQNLGFSTGDDPERVRENRRRFLAFLGVPPSRVVAGEQVHGARVLRVGRPEAGRGALDPGTAIPRTDGLLTTDRGVFLLALSADCPLVGLVAPPALGVGLCHSGWRGVAEGIPSLLAAALALATGVDPARMRAVVSPGIGPCCYPVGRDVLDRLPEPALRAAPIDAEGRGRLDLARAIRNTLEAAGLEPGRVECSGLCSSCRPDLFFSHRRDGARTGRVGMVIGMRE